MNIRNIDEESILLSSGEIASRDETWTNPHAEVPTSLKAMFQSIWQNKSLVVQISKLEIVARYKGSMLGILWAFGTPLLMLAVYTFAFSVVFQAKWGDIGGGKGAFAMVLFTGMIIHALLAEMLIRSPLFIVTNSNYVKKVVFPLEILPVAGIITALFQITVSTIVLLAGIFLTFGTLHWTILLFPLVVLPFAVLSLGIGWLLASLGVFLRDIGQIMGVVSTVLLFLAPIFYPLRAIPEKYQFIILSNPLTFIVEQARAVLILGRLPDWLGLVIYLCVAMLVAWGGFAWFQKTRKGFADVL